MTNSTTHERQNAGKNGLLLAALLDAETPEMKRHQAFGQIVARFQDMAYGYAYSLLGSAELAEEAAQEAFLTAWQKLPQLQSPQAFPAWFKRIVFTHSYGIGRRKRVETVPLEAVDTKDGPHAPLDAGSDPQAALERAELQAITRRSIGELPDGERSVVVLFYLSEYSREEIAEFLEITPLAVKKRLASARRRLKERLASMIQDDLHEQRPSRNGAFTERVLAFSLRFGDLLRAGAPILETLERCAGDNQDSPRMRQAIQDMEQAVQRGKPLHIVMNGYPDVFDHPYIQAIALGEEHGYLDAVLKRLAHGDTLDTPEKQAIFQEEMQRRQEAQRRLPEVMAALPHLFRESDLRAVAIGEETGTVSYVAHRLAAGGVEYDSEDKLRALHEEMTRLSEWLRSKPGTT